MEKKEKPVLERWHGAHHYSNFIHLAFVFILFFAAAIILWSYVEINDLQTKVSSKITKTTPTPSPFEGVVCTMEAKLCPDGIHYVGRSGPNCEFAACPTPETSINKPTPTCIPRPKCLDTKPRCYIAQTENMCPPGLSP